MLSIIVPIYNAEKYLKKCLDSLVNQDYKKKEILLIDDGSKDKSSEICDEYARRYSFIQAIHKENGGCSSARNLGIVQAQGAYLAFVDADDCLDHDFYSILMDNLIKTQSDIVACSYINEYSENFSIKRKQDTVPEPIIFEGYKSALESMTAKKNSIEGFVWNKIWKREIIENQQFRTDVTIIEDSIYSWTAISKIKRACYIDLPMYHYRIIPTSITRNSSLDKYYKALCIYETMIEEAKKIAPKCLHGLSTDYIIWNIKTAEQLLLHSKNVKKDYNKIKNNILIKKKYIKECGFRHRILAKALLHSWKQYRFWGIIFWYLKKVYIMIKK